MQQRQQLITSQRSAKNSFARKAITAIVLGLSAMSLWAQVAVKEVKFVGLQNQELVTSGLHDDLMPLAILGKSLVGKNLSNDEVDDSAVKMSELSRATGRVVSRILVTDADKASAAQTGVLKFMVLEGVVGKVSVTNSSKVKDSRIAKTIAAAVCDSSDDAGNCSGTRVLTAKTMERATLNAGDIPGVRLSPLNLSGDGVGVGQTHITVVADLPAAPMDKFTAYSLGFDNYGAKSVGQNRIAGSLTATNLMGEGDVTTASFTATDKSLYSGAFNFSAPIGYSGLRGYAGLSSSYFNVSEANLVGRSDGVSVGLSYPILRAFDYNLRAAVGFGTGNGKSTFNGETLGQSSSDMLNLGLSLDDGDRRRELGDSFTRGSLNVTSGKLKLKDAASIAFDASSAQTQGSYMKTSYVLLRKQNLTDKGADALYLVGNIHGQTANKNLSGGDKLGTGGVGGVRAYPSDEPAADTGNVLQLDLRQPLTLGGTRVVIGAFYDAAQVNLHKNNWQAGTVNKRSLSGYGLSLEVQPNAGSSIGLMWAKRLGNQDSIADPASKSRFWATAGIQF
jgi:hemolysin activation/secretion protein